MNAIEQDALADTLRRALNGAGILVERADVVRGNLRIGCQCRLR